MPRKAHRLRDVGGLPAGRVGAPVFGQVQFAVDEGMTAGRDVGDYVELTLVILKNGRGIEGQSHITGDKWEFFKLHLSSRKTPTWQFSTRPLTP